MLVSFWSFLFLFFTIFCNKKDIYIHSNYSIFFLYFCCCSELAAIWDNLQEDYPPSALRYIESVAEFCQTYTPNIQQMLLNDARDAEHEAICARFNFTIEEDDV